MRGRTGALKAIGLLATSALVAGAAVMRPVPVGIPAAPQTSKAQAAPPLARYFPAENLVVLAEFDGLQAHADAWSKTATRSILVDTPTGSMIRKLVLRMLQKVNERGERLPVSAEQLVALTEHALGSGFALGIARAPDQPKPSVATLVVRDAKRDPAFAGLNALLGALPRHHAKVKKTRINGRDLSVMEASGGPGLAWWFEGSDLVMSLVGQAGAEQTIAVLNHEVPDATTHARRKALAAGESGFEPVGWAYFDMAALPPLPPDVLALGIGGLKRFEYQWGFEGKALKTVLHVEAPSPRAALLALLDQAPLAADRLPALPPGLSSVSIFSFRPGDFLNRLLEIEGSSPGRKQLAQSLRDIQENTKENAHLDFMNDVLNPIGPTIVFYSLPHTVRASTNPVAGMFAAFTRTPQFVLVADVNDPGKYADTLDSLVPQLNKDLQTLIQRSRVDGGAPMGMMKSAVETRPVFISPVPADVIDVPVAAPTTPESEKPAPDVPREPPKGAPPQALRSVAAASLISVRPVQDDAPHGPQFVKLKPPMRGWTLNQPLGGNFLFGAGMRPTIAVGKRHLIVATTFEAAQRALTLEEQPPGFPADDRLRDSLKAAMTQGATFVSVGDPGESMLPDVLSNLPGLVQSLPVGGRSESPLDLMNRGLPMSMFVMQMLGSPGGPPWLDEPFLPDEIPTADQIRSRLFPASYVFAVDETGFRFESREPFPAFNPASLAPIVVAGLFPAVSSAREAAQRAQSVNNLKQIGLAVHNFLSANNRLPADIRDAEGKPLLSWRVEILPFLEQQALWEQIHKDEPWDSPHNKALLEIMPGTFAIPGTPAPEAGHTFYRGFSGPHTGFEQRRGQPVNIADFTDGTSNTIVVVEANEAVPWLKPDSDLEFDGDAPPNEGKDPRPLMGGHFGRGFNALFMDGSVRFLSESIAPSILRALITRDGGEVISQDQLN